MGEAMLGDAMADAAPGHVQALLDMLKLHVHRRPILMLVPGVAAGLASPEQLQGRA